MKKLGIVFALAVLAPSLVLAWLAMRSVRDQQIVLERQQSLICQGVADGLARSLQEVVVEQQQAFNQLVAELQGRKDKQAPPQNFDRLIREKWELAEVGFVVKSGGAILSPLADRPEATRFLSANGRFLANRESAEVYLNPKQLLGNNAAMLSQNKSAAQMPSDMNSDNRLNYSGKTPLRNVLPQQQAAQPQINSSFEDNQQQFSKLAPSEAEFGQLIGLESEGVVARFVDNKLCLFFWRRAPVDPDLVYGAQVSLNRLRTKLRPVIEQAPADLRSDYCLALLDDTARPVALSHPTFSADWRRPFVATEIGEMLPHWEAAVYVLNPSKLTHAAQSLKLTLSLLIITLVLAIVVGSWLVVADLSRQVRLARQKTDFVSNVSHELKTPLTSIRMFSELLAEERVKDRQKQKAYLGIIAAEAARLTRLINNVLDFSRMERGEKQYDFQPCDFARLVRDTVSTCQANLEANGFALDCNIPNIPLEVNGDKDALAQVIVNLLSNAEKYSLEGKQVQVELRAVGGPLPHVELNVKDRGMGVPKGSEEKIFEKFYRAHDALSSGIQGSGLGLTLARQIARAHGGDLTYRTREKGGSCFTLRLPRITQS